MIGIAYTFEEGRPRMPRLRCDSTNCESINIFASQRLLAPEAFRREPRTVTQSLKLAPYDVFRDPFPADERTKTTIHAGDHSLSVTDGRHDSFYSLCNDLWMLDDIDFRIDYTWHYHQVIRHLVFAQCGEGQAESSVFAVRPATDGKSAQKVYEVVRTGGYVPTPIAVGDLLFLWKENGLVTCLRAANNEQVWSQVLLMEYRWSS